MNSYEDYDYKAELKEEEIFEEWYNLNFDVIPDPLEYIYYRECLGFQRYLLWYRYRGLVESIKKELFNIIEKFVSIVSNIRKRWKR